MIFDHGGLGVGRPVAPQDRPRKERRGARVVIMTPDERVLLTERFDPGLPDSGWWTTPGGGVEPGESDRAAALRELWEETGQRVDPGALLGPVATRVVTHGYTDQIARQTEVFFLWCVPGEFTPEPQVVTERELVSTRESRWWGLTELAEADVWSWDPIAVLWELRTQPERWVVDLGDVDLSPVPVS